MPVLIFFVLVLAFGQDGTEPQTPVPNGNQSMEPVEPNPEEDDEVELLIFACVMGPLSVMIGRLPFSTLADTLEELPPRPLLSLLGQLLCHSFGLVLAFPSMILFLPLFLLTS